MSTKIIVSYDGTANEDDAIARFLPNTIEISGCEPNPLWKDELLYPMSNKSLYLWNLTIL